MLTRERDRISVSYYPESLNRDTPMNPECNLHGRSGATRGSMIVGTRF